jgi:hypothetical protein
MVLRQERATVFYKASSHSGGRFYCNSMLSQILRRGSLPFHAITEKVSARLNAWLLRLFREAGMLTILCKRGASGKGRGKDVKKSDYQRLQRLWREPRRASRGP